MSKHTVKIDEAYFAELGARYRNEFNKANDAISYVNNTKDLYGLGLLSEFNKAVKSSQDGLVYDITCISTVFSSADAKMKKRAEELIGTDIINGVAGGNSITVDYYDIKPDLDEPRQLPNTQYGYTVDDNGNRVYDHPKETEKYLYRDQGKANPKVTGTCGLCSAANVLRLAGVNYNEKDMLDYAQANDLCSSDGGTKPYQIAALLNHFGLNSSCVKVPCKDGYATDEALNQIANYVESGRGVIIPVYAYALWPGYSGARDGLHALTVTSVTRDSSGNIIGFSICDSNPGLPSYYSADKIKNALVDWDMVVTDSVIR